MADIVITPSSVNGSDKVIAEMSRSTVVEGGKSYLEVVYTFTYKTSSQDVKLCFSNPGIKTVQLAEVLTREFYYYCCRLAEKGIIVG